MGSSLPYAADAESPLKPVELQVLRSQYEKEGEHVGVQTKFNFAWGLIKSDTRNEQQEGVRLLSDIFRTSPERRRECLYYLALGNYKLGNYAEARRYNDLLLDKEPSNLQASSLRGLIDDKVAREGLMGVAILSGVAIAAGVRIIANLEEALFKALLTHGPQDATLIVHVVEVNKAPTPVWRSLALSLGLTAFAAYQGLRDAMADNLGQSGGRLDASGPRDVVFCHQCENEWFQDQYGLVCPRCEGEITEIVTPESDPRPERAPRQRPEAPHPEWNNREPEYIDSDPEEADIEEHVTHGPGGSMLFSRTIRTTTNGSLPRPRYASRYSPNPDPDRVMRDFQNMIGNLMGSEFRPGQAGRSNSNTLFNQGPVGGGNLHSGPNGGHGPAVAGGHFTFVNGGLFGDPSWPRDPGGPQPTGGHIDIATYDIPPCPIPKGCFLHTVQSEVPSEAPSNQQSRLIGGVFDPSQGGQRDIRGMPAGLQGLFSALLNPVNARSGDAVYSQEALDQIISTLMEQHPTSNAPGPASPDAIAALPKKNLSEKELGAEGKGECSVCMDDVTLGVEVVLLPCSHWFHEACASAWLSEHNTCPICRKGIEGGTAPSPNLSNSRRPSQTGPTSRNEARARRLSAITPRLPRTGSHGSVAARNEANAQRLEMIRNNGRLSPTDEPQSSGQWNFGAESVHPADDYPGTMPGIFHRRQSEMSDNQRDARRGNTSSSDRPRESRRSSHSGAGGGSGGAIGWIRDRLGGGGGRRNE
ncbi:mitochondria fission 1 protein [Diplocarpon rosae]|nr:mitochondria fission 1 protein [Diplocarpon rosae]